MKAPAPTAEPRLYTVERACELLEVGKDKIYALMRSGELAFIKLPPGTKRSGRRIEHAEIEQFLARNRGGGTAAQ
jgi:excisionase family DNA binding protein